MAEERVQRRLAAILAADVAGYSRLMGEDEEGTHATLTAHRTELIEPCIAEHRGRVVKTTGDGLLAEFASVVDAVRCAVAFQEGMRERNTETPEDQRIDFRIGVNLGDVIVQDDDVFGDGVNVAARLEGLAAPGSIVVSGMVHEAVRAKLDFGYDDLGSHEVKNIAEPVHVYRVLTESEAAGKVTGETKRATKSRKRVAPAVAMVVLIAVAGAVTWLRPWEPKIEPASVEKMAFPLPDKPSIAVLPFTNISDDPEQEYFADGMTEDLITDLSKISGLFVIARNSTFSYKGQQVKLRQVAEELGVRYVLEGSVRRAGNQVRINAQLIDATTGGHLWAERYDGTIDNVFALQDQITRKITKALALKLTPSEKKTVADRGTKVIEAHDAFLKGWAYYLQSTPSDLVAAATHFKEAIALDADYGHAHAALALTYRLASQRFWGIHFGFNWKWARLLMIRHLETALKTPSSIAHRLASSVYIDQRRYAESIAAARRAIELSPNSAEAYRTLAYALVMNGQPAEAREMVEKAWRLDPRGAGQHFFLLGLTAFAEANLEQAASLIERARNHLKQAQSFLPPLIAAYMHLGRADEGRALSDVFYDWFPMYSTELRTIMYFWPFRDKAVAARLADGLLLAGIPGKSGGHYNLSDEHRLTGLEIADLFKNFGRKWKVHDVREFGDHRMTLTDSFQEDGTVMRFHEVWGTSGVYNFEWYGRYRIDGDLLCEDFQEIVVGGVGCRPVFRNPDATRGGDNEYVIVGALGFYEISSAD